MEIIAAEPGFDHIVTSLFIDIIFALHYGFIFHLSDAVFTAIVPSA